MPPRDDAPIDALSAWAQQWREWCLYAGAFQRASLDWIALCCDPVPRNRWLTGVSQMFDGYARTAGFLELAQQNMRALIAFQRFTEPFRNR